MEGKENGPDGDREQGRLVAYLDYVCPYCYLAESLLARLRREEDVEIEYRPFELRPSPAPMLDPDDPAFRRAWTRAIEPLAESIGVEVRYPPVQPRTRKAHEAVAMARAQGRGVEMHETLFRAFFVEGRDIGRIDVLLDLVEVVGLDRRDLKVALDIDQYTEPVEAAQEEAVRRGIDGVPAVVAGGETLVGLQPYDVLRRFAAP